jgi:hypothetical protein
LTKLFKALNFKDVTHITLFWGHVMVRASKLPYDNFEYNMRRALALARLDGYLEDISTNEGKRTIGVFFDMQKELGQILGIDDLMKEIEKTIEAHLKKELELKGKEQIEESGKRVFKRLKPWIEKISEMFEDLGLVMDQTLLEQALVMAVSAFEVYLRELAVSIVTLNPGIRKRFTPEIESELSLARLEDYKDDVKRTKGEIVADLVKLEPRRVRSVLRRLIGEEDVFGGRQTEQKVRRILECRHIVVHRAGLIDPKFKKVTKYRGAIDRQIEISRRYVLESIGVLQKVVDRVESAVHPTTG